MRSYIKATGSYLPPKVLTNYDLERMVDTSDEWIKERTGISERRIVDENTASSDLAYEAAKKVLEEVNLDPKDLELIIVATITPDMFFPSTGCFVQEKLNAKNAAAFDISAACSGFIYGIAIADQFIKNKIFKNALVIGAETLSKVTDWQDRSSCILFGDAAGAVLMESTNEDRGILDYILCSDGSYWELLNLPGGGSRYPASYKTIENRMHYMKMRGNEVFKVAVRCMEDVSLKILKRNNITPENIRFFIPHQANIRIIKSVAKRLKIPMEKVYITIHKYGNTSAASIPVALDEANRKGLLKKGDIILMSAFGGGFTWASALVKW